MLDIEQDDVDHFAAAFAECDAVVFAAGGGPDGNIERKRTVDLGGSLKSIEAAQQAGIDRFVQISAINVDHPVPDDAEPVWKAYVEAKRDADIALRDSGLDWTILRPGRLTNDEATGQVALGETVERGEIPRADVAAVVVAVLDDPTLDRAPVEPGRRSDPGGRSRRVGLIRRGLRPGLLRRPGQRAQLGPVDLAAGHQGQLVDAAAAGAAPTRAAGRPR